MLTYFVSQNTSSQLQTGCASSWPCWHCAPPSSWILRCTTCCRCPWWDCWAHILCVYLVCLFVAVYMGLVLWLWSSVYSNALPSRVCVSTYSPFFHYMCNILFHLSKPTEAVIEPFLQGSLPLLASVCWFRCEVSKNWCLPSPFRMFGICCFNFMLLTMKSLWPTLSEDTNMQHKWKEIWLQLLEQLHSTFVCAHVHCVLLPLIACATFVLLSLEFY